jgi:hypothetical protein
MRAGLARVAGVAAVLAVLGTTSPATGELLYVTEGNNLRRIDLASLDGPGPTRTDVLVEHASRGEEAGARSRHTDPRRRDVNGMVCRLPDGSGRFVAGEDTGQPTPPPGWGVFTADGRPVGKLTATYFVEQGEPYGCGFDAQGRLFTTELGNVGFGRPRGQLILWYPPFARFPGPPGAYPDTTATSGNFCKLATDIGNAIGLAIDDRGRVYVASSGRGAIHRFTPPFPAAPDAASGCGARDASGAPLAEAVRREVFFRGLYTFSGLAMAPNGHLYAASVFTGEILELDLEGRLVRAVLEPEGWLPPFPTGNPMGLAVGADGALYYTDLDLTWDGLSIAPGPDGKVRRIRFDAAGDPLPPEILMDGLAFPDGLGVGPGALPDANPDTP